MFPPALLERATALLDVYRTKGWRIATAESCTGGLVAGLLTEIAGSSDVVERGYVTYSDAAKTGLLGVSSLTIAEHGAVSEPVARAMAQGALGRSEAQVAVSITGVAGPGGATEHLERRYGDLGRGAVRLAAVEDALALLEQAVRED